MEMALRLHVRVSQRLNITLDEERAAKLARLADARSSSAATGG